VPLPKPGQYAFEISLDGEPANRVALSAGYPQQLGEEKRER
jgi:hypothetical protein